MDIQFSGAVDFAPLFDTMPNPAASPATARAPAQPAAQPAELYTANQQIMTAIEPEAAREAFYAGTGGPLNIIA